MKQESFQPGDIGRRQALATQITTLADLQDLKHELIAEFRKLLKELGGQPGKKWLKRDL